MFFPLPIGVGSGLHCANECKQSRRGFLRCSIGIATLTSGVFVRRQTRAQTTRLKAVVIGHTGHGDYGHDHDLIFKDRGNIQVVAVADPDEAGRAKAAARVQALRSYADYREMISKEQPQLASVALRCSDVHHAMALAALKTGAHVYIEKPITETLAQADELLAVAKKMGLKIAVPHQMRLAPNIVLLKQRLQEGFIGDLLEIRGHGKQDRRSGGEDMIVLGTHLFDLMRLFTGDPHWCSAKILQKGHEIRLQDSHAATESIGPVVGDDIVAQFAFANGVSGTFVSREKNQSVAGPWGLELIGTKNSVRILTGTVPRIYFKKPGAWTGEGNVSEWRVWEEDPILKFNAAERTLAKANERVVNDWLAAISENREPVCSGEAATRALEMAMAIFSAGVTRRRVEFPLKNREHPLR
jgi:predicted dehydrogenase